MPLFSGPSMTQFLMLLNSTTTYDSDNDTPVNYDTPPIRLAQHFQSSHDVTSRGYDVTQEERMVLSDGTLVKRPSLIKRMKTKATDAVNKLKRKATGSTRRASKEMVETERKLEQSMMKYEERRSKSRAKSRSRTDTKEGFWSCRMNTIFI